VGGKRVNLPIPNNGLDTSQNPGVIDLKYISACDGWIAHKDLIRKDWELVRIRASTGPAGVREIGEIPGCDDDMPEYHITPYDGIKDGLFPGWDNMSDWSDSGSDSFWCVNYPFTAILSGGAAGCNPNNVLLTGQTEEGGKVVLMEDDVDYQDLDYSYDSPTDTITITFEVINSDINNLSIDVESLCPQDEDETWEDVSDDDYFIDDGPGMEE